MRVSQKLISIWSATEGKKKLSAIISELTDCHKGLFSKVTCSHSSLAETTLRAYFAIGGFK